MDKAITNRLYTSLTLSTDIDGDGVIRWIANGRVLSPEIVTVAQEIGLPVIPRNCDHVRIDDLEYARAA